MAYSGIDRQFFRSTRYSNASPVAGNENHRNSMRGKHAQAALIFECGDKAVFLPKSTPDAHQGVNRCCLIHPTTEHTHSVHLVTNLKHVPFTIIKSPRPTSTAGVTDSPDAYISVFNTVRFIAPRWMVFELQRSQRLTVLVILCVLCVLCVLCG